MSARPSQLGDESGRAGRPSRPPDAVRSAGSMERPRVDPGERIPFMNVDEQPQWISRAVAELIGYPPMVEFLEALLVSRAHEARRRLLRSGRS